MKKHIFPILLIIFIVGFNNLQAQYSEKIVDIAAEPLVEGEAINITIELSTTTVCCKKLEFAYRKYGETEFKILEMNLRGNLASTLIPAYDVIPPFIEYYVILHPLSDEHPETYPIENPELSPIRLLIKEKLFTKIIWYSPAQNEQTTAEDLLIAFSIDNTDTAIDVKNKKVFLNGIDISEKIFQAEDLYIAKLEKENIPTGNNSIRVELYDHNLEIKVSESRQFRVIDFSKSMGRIPTIKYNTSVLLENRNENIAGASYNYRNANIYAKSEYNFIKVNTNLYFTSEEKSYRQPQNRYFFGIEIPYLKLGYGDSYPIFPNLIITGKRVRGLTLNTQLGFFGLDFIYGSTNRKIESEIQIVDSPDDPSKIYFRKDDSTWIMLLRQGVFTRNMLLIRPTFGQSETFTLGFTYLKAKDDKNSIKYGLMPKENLVLGSDLRIAFDKRRIELSAQAAFSAVNNDISTGTIPDEDIDSLFKSLTESERDLIRKAKNTLSKFITVNEHIVPLSLKNLTTLAYEGALSLNYLNNFFKISYIRRGSAYESFGQSYLRKDIQGFNLIDRLRVFKNKLHLSIGLEQLKDNTDNSKPATTYYSTLSSAISYYPTANLPNFTLGYVFGTTKNNADNFLYQINDRSNRLFISLNYNFNYLMNNNFSINFSTSRRDDKSLNNVDTRSTTAGMSLMSFYKIPLQTSFNITYTSSSYLIPSNSEIVKLKYYSINILSHYQMLSNKLKLSFGIRPTLGDIKRNAFDFSTEYEILSRLIITGNLNIYLYQEKTTESIFGIVLRYDI